MINKRTLEQCIELIDKIDAMEEDLHTEESEWCDDDWWRDVDEEDIEQAYNVIREECTYIPSMDPDGSCWDKYQFNGMFAGRLESLSVDDMWFLKCLIKLALREKIELYLPDDFENNVCNWYARGKESDGREYCCWGYQVFYTLK